MSASREMGADILYAPCHLSVKSLCLISIEDAYYAEKYIKTENYFFTENKNAPAENRSTGALLNAVKQVFNSLIQHYSNFHSHSRQLYIHMRMYKELDYRFDLRQV